MPYLKIWIHVIWSTKNRNSLISKNLKPVLMEHNAAGKGIYIDFLNCVSDHIHFLISLHSDQTISNVVQLLKGESSFWVNKEKLTNFKFEWQDEYIAVSVSESQVNKIRDYIRNQDVHHQKRTFSEEHEEFMNKYGFKR